MKSGIEAKLCTAALKLAAKRGWSSLTLEQIAVAAKISTAQARKVFPEKNRLLPALVEYMDERTAAAAGKINPRETVHDRLFQVMMARFDGLQKDRAGILAIAGECRSDPALARLILPAQIRSMQKMLALAQVFSRGPWPHMAAVGLLAVYYRALWCWQGDQTRDMARTMAALDQGLRCADRLAAILLRNS